MKTYEKKTTVAVRRGGVVVSYLPLWFLRVQRTTMLRDTFYALAFLPYNQESQQCVESIPNRSTDGRLIDASQVNLNFFVRYVSKVDKPSEFRSNINSTWEAINSTRSATLNNIL